MNKPTIEKFLEMVDSLKKSLRADLSDDPNAQKELIEKLYTDPVDGDFVLSTMLNDQTTLLIGRKGTGKSTIINRFQHEVRKTKNKISLYLDVRTIYENSNSSIPSGAKIPNGLSPEEQKKHELYKHFIQEVIKEIYNEINKDLFVNRFKQFFSGGITENDFKKQLDAIKNEILTPKFDDITGLIQFKTTENSSYKHEQKVDKNRSLELNPKLIDKKEFSFFNYKEGKISSNSSSNSLSNNDEYTKLLIRYFNITELIQKIKTLLAKIGITRIAICLDDSSELDKEALDIFMRTIVAPLHNNSEGFFRFKISFYPKRDYLPLIDRTKIDTLFLDYYDLYKTSVDKVESEAIAYTKRLLETRFKYYFGNDVRLEDFFDTQKINLNDYFKLIFQITANIPRNIGKLLWYAGRRSITKGEKITKKVLQDASKEQYTSDIENILTKRQILQYKSYEERYEREHLKRLLDSIVDKAKQNKSHIGKSIADIFKDYNPNNAPSNYLYVPESFEEYLSTLELNFFISKFNYQKDKGYGSGDKYIPPKDVIVYTINYGLCQKENIIVDEGSDRKFRTERIFDYSSLIMDWANSSQIIRCSNCKTTYDISEWETIDSFNRMCRVCKQCTCNIETIEIKPTEVIVLEEGLKLSQRDFDVLNTLRQENGLTVRQISAEIDCAYQAVNQSIRRDRFLVTNGFIEKPSEQDKKYFITEKAIKIYFNNATN